MQTLAQFQCIKATTLATDCIILYADSQRNAMFFKLALFSAFVAIARAGVIAAPGPLALSYAAPVAKYAAPLAVAKTVVADDYDPHPQYSFAYDIQDGLTGDSKSQQETRDGDVVQGSYSLIDSDGTKRTVEYIADPHNGFNAVVHREPIGVAVKAVAPVAKYAAPVAYASPYAKLAYPAYH